MNKEQGMGNDLAILWGCVALFWWQVGWHWDVANVGWLTTRLSPLGAVSLIRAPLPQHTPTGKGRGFPGLWLQGQTILTCEHLADAMTSLTHLLSCEMDIIPLPSLREQL